jgi:TrmH family RNA methyltransferase
LLITSRTNARVKEVRSLRQKKTRQENGLFLAEGIHIVGEAIAAAQQGKIQLEYLCYAPELLTSAFAQELLAQEQARGTPCLACSAQVFEGLAEKENPQGIIAVLRQPLTSLSGLNGDSFPWGVALVEPQDPGNLGTILRSVDAVGASGVLLVGGSVDAWHPSAVRASMGALFWYPVVAINFAEFPAWAARQGYHIYGTSAHGSTDYRQAGRYQRPAILLMGSERLGLTQAQASICEHLIQLPMHGRATSLNLAVATGVMLYAMLEAG